MSRGQRTNSSNKTFPAKYRYWSTTATCISVKATIFWNKILKLNYQFFENLQEQEKNCIQVSSGEVPLYVNKTFFWKYKSLSNECQCMLPTKKCRALLKADIEHLDLVSQFFNITQLFIRRSNEFNQMYNIYSITWNIR